MENAASDWVECLYAANKEKANVSFQGFKNTLAELLQLSFVGQRNQTRSIREQLRHSSGGFMHRPLGAMFDLGCDFMLAVRFDHGFDDCFLSIDIALHTFARQLG